ncbi:hypothetical protein HY493_05865 [Candidatus Woesearchaeota archaeon]|nr:hypothetical protein [Candidatus Woesearchaeota archaeon]
MADKTGSDEQVKASFDLGGGYWKIAVFGEQGALRIPDDELAVFGDKTMYEPRTGKDPVVVASVPSCVLKITNPNLSNMFGRSVFYGRQAQEIMEQIQVDGRIRPEDGKGGYVIRGGRVADHELFALGFNHIVGYVQSKSVVGIFALPPEEMAELHEAKAQSRKPNESAQLIIDLMRSNKALALKKAISQGAGGAASEGYGIDKMCHSIYASIGEVTTDVVGVHMSDPTYTPHSHVETLKRSVKTNDETRLVNFASAEMINSIRYNLNHINDVDPKTSERKYPWAMTFSLDDARRVFVDYGAVTKAHLPECKGKYECIDDTLATREIDISDAVVDACSPMVKLMAEAIQKVGKVGQSQIARRQMLENIILGGGGSHLRGLGEEVTKELKTRGVIAKITRLADPVYGTAIGGLRIAKKLALTSWDQGKTEDRKD